MNTEEKHKFIAKASINILAAMFSNPEKDPDEKIAIQYAELLWDKLIEKRIV